MRDACWKSVVAAVALVLGVAACDLAESVAARKRQPVVLSSDLSLHRLGRELWLYTSWSVDEGTRQSANGLVVVGDDAVILIDTPLGEQSTIALLDWVEAELRLPIRSVVITSAHGDRTRGHAVLEAHGIDSIGCQETLRLAEEHGVPAPTRSFARQELLTLDDETLVLFHPGPGHSPDNVVVHLRRAKLLFGGCLVRSLEADTLGSTKGADLSSWSTALRLVRERFSFADRVVPGHGNPGGQELIEHTFSLLEAQGG